MHRHHTTVVREGQPHRSNRTRCHLAPGISIVCASFRSTHSRPPPKDSFCVSLERLPVKHLQPRKLWWFTESFKTMLSLAGKSGLVLRLALRRRAGRSNTIARTSRWRGAVVQHAHAYPLLRRANTRTCALPAPSETHRELKRLGGICGISLARIQRVVHTATGSL